MRVIVSCPIIIKPGIVQPLSGEFDVVTYVARTGGTEAEVLDGAYQVAGIIRRQGRTGKVVLVQVLKYCSFLLGDDAGAEIVIAGLIGCGGVLLIILVYIDSYLAALFPFFFS